MPDFVLNFTVVGFFAVLMKATNLTFFLAMRVMLSLLPDHGKRLHVREFAELAELTQKGVRRLCELN